MAFPYKSLCSDPGTVQKPDILQIALELCENIFTFLHGFLPQEKKEMVKKSVNVGLSGGLLASPVALLVQKANEYESSVYIESTGKRVNAKSIMGMMSLGLGEGDAVTVVCEGSDEEAATESVESFLLGKAV